MSSSCTYTFLIIHHSHKLLKKNTHQVTFIEYIDTYLQFIMQNVIVYVHNKM